MDRKDDVYVVVGGPTILQRLVSVASSSSSSNNPLLSGEEEEEVADREEYLIDLSEDKDVVKNQTAFFTDHDEFYQTAMADADGGPEMGNQTALSAVDVEANADEIPIENQRLQQSRGGASVHSVDDVRSSGKSRGSRDRPHGSERKTSLITTYEEQVKENLILRKRP
ncbi:hypothetical protein R1sor_014189 [Riccia sorocarpa]|uniref:Uncharacterized protein n=1 Tax=Riccia sorocarpa TaxID=122646 RepID=A0ABD3HBV5_9MARC